MCSPKELQPGTVFKCHFKRQCRGRKGNVMYIYIEYLFTLYGNPLDVQYLKYTQNMNWTGILRMALKCFEWLHDIANTMTLSTYISFFSHVIWPHGALPGPAMAEPQVPEPSQVPQAWQGDVARRQEMPRHEGGGAKGWMVRYGQSVMMQVARDITWPITTH